MWLAGSRLESLSNRGRDDAVAYDANLGIRVHGVDLRQSDDFTDEDMKTRGDAFTVAMGISV
jgi:hypothetical protein